MSEKKWCNYIIFDSLKSKKTYIGSTVNPTRRFRQHNQEIKGGAKYTRGGIWHPYIILFHISHTKSSALSYEWHLKYSSKKFKDSPHIKRKKGLEKFLFGKTSWKVGIYTHILFVNSIYKNITPLVTSNILIIYLSTKDFTTQIISQWIEQILQVNRIKLQHEDKLPL